VDLQQGFRVGQIRLSCHRSQEERSRYAANRAMTSGAMLRGKGV
jgi:hypothetical protein